MFSHFNCSKYFCFLHLTKFIKNFFSKILFHWYGAYSICLFLFQAGGLLAGAKIDFFVATANDSHPLTVVTKNFILQPWTKTVAKAKHFPFPQLSMLFLVRQCNEPGGNIIGTGGRAFFRIKLYNLENSVFLKIFILSQRLSHYFVKKVRKLYLSFSSLFEH